MTETERKLLRFERLGRKFGSHSKKERREFVQLQKFSSELHDLHNLAELSLDLLKLRKSQYKFQDELRKVESRLSFLGIGGNK